MWTSLNKKLYWLMAILLVIGIIVGIVFVVMLDESTKEIIFLNINEMIQNINNIHINNMLMHLLILSSLFILSIFVVGGPLIVFFMFYNGFSLGFIITTLTYVFGIKGLLYSVIYIIISKGLFLLGLIIFNVTLIKIVKNMIDIVLRRNIKRDVLVILFKKAVLCLGFVLLSDIILYFGGAKLINLFNFLII